MILQLVLYNTLYLVQQYFNTYPDHADTFRLTRFIGHFFGYFSLRTYYKKLHNTLGMNGYNTVRRVADPEDPNMSILRSVQNHAK